jgi:hypothetical protein
MNNARLGLHYVVPAALVTMFAACGGSKDPGRTSESAPSNGLEGAYFLYGEFSGDDSTRPRITLKSGGKGGLLGLGAQLEGKYEIKGVQLTLTLPGERHDLVIDGKGCLLGGLLGDFCKKGSAPARALSASTGANGAGAISGTYFAPDGDNMTQLDFQSDGRVAVSHWIGNQLSPPVLGLYDAEGDRITITSDGPPMVLERKGDKFETNVDGKPVTFSHE